MPSVDLSGGAGGGGGGGGGIDLGFGGGSPPMSGAGAPPGGPGAGGAASSSGGAGANLGAYAAQAALNDPAVQAHIKEQAYQQAQQGYNVAREGAAQAVSELRKYVQEGPAGISILCFLGGIATTIVGFLGLLNISGGLTSPFTYVLNVYLTMFGLVTFLLEADMESFKNMKVLGKLAPFVEQYQREVFDRAKVLTELRGRGFYYVFIGSLAITQCFLCLLFLVGVWNLLMGVLCLMMSFGINPADHMQMAPGGGYPGRGYPDHGSPLYDPRQGP